MEKFDTKKLAIIGGGYMACIYAKNASEMQIETFAFSLKDGMVDETAFDHVYDVNILDKETVLQKCKEIGIDGIVATTELTISTAAYVAEMMGLIGIPYNTANVITDKYRNRIAIKDSNILLQPKFCEVNSYEEILDLDFSYPLVLKPTSKGGKRGVIVINNKDEVKTAFTYALQDSGNALPFIIEEFIEADMECSVESLSYKGSHYIVQITEKETSGPPHCVELGHHQPANLPCEILNKIRTAISFGLSAIGIENGPCHTEVRIKGENIYLVEFNARPGGDHIAYPLTELSTGYPYIKGAIKIAINNFNGVELNSNESRFAGVLFVAKQTSFLKPIFDECEKYDWCYKKNVASKDLQSITHNNGFNLNYFIYCGLKRPDFTINE